MYFRPALKRPPDPPSKRKTRAAANGIELWRSAMRWRRAVESELRAVDLTLTQWLILDATEALLETAPVVNQNAVASRADLDRMTVSQVLRALELRGLVDRTPDPRGRALRVLLTARGRRAVADGRTCIETGSARALAEAAAKPAAASSGRRFRPRNGR